MNFPEKSSHVFNQLFAIIYAANLGKSLLGDANSYLCPIENTFVTPAKSTGVMVAEAHT